MKAGPSTSLRAGIIAAGWGERLQAGKPKPLVQVGEQPLIQHVLSSLQEAGITEAVCIINEASRAVQSFVSNLRLSFPVRWIVQTTPSSMHSFLRVLETLAGAHDPGPFLVTTVDTVASPGVYRRFVQASQKHSEADAILALTDWIDDEKPLRALIRGIRNTGIPPPEGEETERPPDGAADDPSAYELVSLGSRGFDSPFATAGYYLVRSSVLQEKEAALHKNLGALREFFMHLLQRGYRLYGLPMPRSVDVDRPEDIKAAERIPLTLPSPTRGEESFLTSSPLMGEDEGEGERP